MFGRVTLIFLFCFPPLFAQEVRPVRSPDDHGLPIYLTREEMNRLDRIGEKRTITDPPPGPVRAAAEWEESIGVFTLWPNAELINELQKDNDVYIITENKNWWLNWLASNGIPSTNFHFLIAPTDTWYTRDYGPWFIWDGNDQFGLVDTIYNRPRPKDDVIPEKIAREYGIPYYGVDLIHTGGNYYTDGYGTAWSTQLVYQENPGKTKAEVDQLMYEYLGITRYVTPKIDYSIEHMDTFGKPLAPDTLIWGKFPDFSTPWFYCEAALKVLQTLQSSYGWPYKILRMPLWDQGGSWTAYINALQTNRKILTGKYGTGHDAEAKAIYEAAAPGYEVINVDAMGTGWGDSIHCRTRNFVRAETIRIYPHPHWECTDDDLNPYTVEAEVIPHPSTALKSDPVIRWTVTGGPPFSEAVMSPTGIPHEYEGAVPAQPHGTTIAYYIHAEDLAGSTKDVPPVAPDGLFTIQVEEDATPPQLDHHVIHGLTPADWPCLVTCTSTDDTGIPDLTLEYMINGSPQPPVAMEREEGTFNFSGLMEGTVVLGDLVAYRITAADHANPPNTRTCPPVGWNVFPVTRKNRVLIVEADVTPDTGTVLQGVCDDLGLNAHYTTQFPAELSSYEVLMICLGMTPTNTHLTYAQANTLINFMNGGGAVYLEGGDAFSQGPGSGVYDPYFGIAAASNGKNIQPPVTGEPATFTEGMQFGYYGEHMESDDLSPDPAATVVLENQDKVKSVLFDTGTYRAAAVSLQLGSLKEGSPPNHLKALVAGYIEHLGIDLHLLVHGRMDNTRNLRFELDGDPLASYMLFYALGPGFYPLPPAGIVQIDLSTLALLGAGVLPAEGKLVFDVILPEDPALAGLEIYFQGGLQTSGPGGWVLTNRDRVTLVFD